MDLSRALRPPAMISAAGAHDKGIRLHYLQPELPFHMRSCSGNSIPMEKLPRLYSRNLIGNFSDLVCPFCFLFLNVTTDFTIIKALRDIRTSILVHAFGIINDGKNPSCIFVPQMVVLTLRQPQRSLPPRRHWPLKDMCVQPLFQSEMSLTSL